MLIALIVIGVICYRRRKAKAEANYQNMPNE